MFGVVAKRKAPGPSGNAKAAAKAAAIVQPDDQPNMNQKDRRERNKRIDKFLKDLRKRKSLSDKRFSKRVLRRVKAAMLLPAEERDEAIESIDFSKYEETPEVANLRAILPLKKAPTTLIKVKTGALSLETLVKMRYSVLCFSCV